MVKKTIAAMVVFGCIGFVGACGDSPVAPGRVPQPDDNNPLKTPPGGVQPVPPAASPAPGPAAASRRLVDHVVRRDTLEGVEWTLTMTDAPYSIDSFLVAGQHCDQAVMEPCNDTKRPIPFRIIGETEYDMGQPIRVTFVMKWADLRKCGRGQFDVDARKHNGEVEPVVFALLLAPTGKSCDGDNTCVPETSFEGYASFSLSGNTMTATVNARHEAVGHRLYLTSFGIPSNYWPREKVGESSQVMTFGTNSLSVQIAPRSFIGWQVKFACVPGPRFADEHFYSHANLLDGRSGLY